MLQKRHLQVEGQVGLIMVTQWDQDRRSSSLVVVMMELLMTKAASL